jgi:hypothetical protein
MELDHTFLTAISVDPETLTIARHCRLPDDVGILTYSELGSYALVIDAGNELWEVDDESKTILFSSLRGI